MRLHVVDGTYELFRAHFAPIGDRLDRDGRPVKATAQLVASLLGLLHEREEQVTHIGVAFDNPIRSFRNDLWPGYKDDTGVPQELLDQFDLAEDATRALGVTVWSMDRFEADDALATAAARFADEVDQVRICSPDKDLGQCVRGDRVVQIDRRQRKVSDADGVRARLGVPPESVPDYLALVGDSADGYPGLPGFGAKTAAALLSRYGHLEAIPRDGSPWPVAVRGQARLVAALVEGWDLALLFRHLATAVLDVPLDEDLDDLRWPGVPKADYLAWCDDLGVDDLRDRPWRWSG